MLTWNVQQAFSNITGNGSYTRTSKPLTPKDRGLLTLILGLEPPTSVTGDTHLCFGRLALLSPIKNTPSSPSLSTFPSQTLGEMNHMEQINP
jgi:hypothetical protein